MNIFSRLLIGALMLVTALGAAAPSGNSFFAPSIQAGPSPVALLEPEDGAYIWPPVVTLRWEPLEGVDTYMVTYINEAEPTVTKEFLVQGTQATLELAAGVSYQWWVTAVYPILHGMPAAGTSIEATPAPPQILPPAPQVGRRTFTISETPLAPAPPRSSIPHTGGYNDRVRLTWQPSFRAERYFIDRANLATGEVQRVGETPAAAFEDLSAAVGQTYLYTITACSSVGCSQPLETMNWVGTCQPALPAPALVRPVEGAIVPESLYRLEWSPVAKVSAYEVEVIDRNNQQILLQQVSLNPFLPVMLQGSLSWRVRAQDPVIGCPAGPWSVPGNYTAQPPFPVPPSPAVP